MTTSFDELGRARVATFEAIGLDTETLVPLIGYWVTSGRCGERASQWGFEECGDAVAITNLRPMHASRRLSDVTSER